MPVFKGIEVAGLRTARARSGRGFVAEHPMFKGVDVARLRTFVSQVWSFLPTGTLCTLCAFDTIILAHLFVIFKPRGELYAHGLVTDAG